MNGAQRDEPAHVDESEMSYEELVEALEHVTQRMADGQVGIEQAADLYERARRLHELASDRLDRVKERIDRLAGDDQA